MLRYICILALLVTVTAAAPAKSQEADVGCASGCAASCSCGNACPGTCCCEACCPTMEKVTEERSCWNVHCEKVCVPAIRLPWEPGGSGLTLFNCLHKYLKGKGCGAVCCQCGTAPNCCDPCCACETCCQCPAPRCGCVRCVNVLEKETYEVTKCQCKWEIQCVPTCDHDGTENCCDQINIPCAQPIP
jgi:hypothetical protein